MIAPHSMTVKAVSLGFNENNTIIPNYVQLYDIQNWIRDTYHTHIYIYFEDMGIFKNLYTIRICKKNIGTNGIDNRDFEKYEIALSHGIESVLFELKN